MPVIQGEFRSIAKEEFDKCLKFIDRPIESGACIMWIEKDREHKNMEVIILFQDEFYYKVKGRDTGKMHDENLAMETEVSFMRDFTISIRKKDVSSVSVYRPPLCECGNPTTPHQPKFYELEVSGGGSDFSITIHDRKAVYVMYDQIRDWQFGRGAFKKTMFQKIKSFIKNIF